MPMINQTGRGLGLPAMLLANLWHMEKWLPPRQDGTRSLWKSSELLAVPHRSSLLVTIFIPLGRQSVLGSGGSFLREQNRKIMWLSFWYSDTPREGMLLMVMSVDCTV